MKLLPNLISCLRVILAITLLFLIDKLVLFVCVYLLCGISDVLDGSLARLLNAETQFGSKLDSMGDLVFFAVCLYALFSFVSKDAFNLLFICITIVLIIRTLNLILTKIKFRQWFIMHTIGNKVTGLFLFFMLPICIIVHNISSLYIIAVSIIAALSALEESVILIKSKNYNPDKRSIFLSE